MKFLKRLIYVLAILIILLAVFLRVRYGGGNHYPDLTTEPKYGPEALEVVLSTEDPIGNAAVSATGRIFYTVHPESRPEYNKLMEWKNGDAVPYPSSNFQENLIAPQGIAVDQKNWLWVSDHGQHGILGAKLFAFDLNTNKLVHEHEFSPEVSEFGSFIQDLQVDSTSETVYLADVSFWRKNPALIVYDVQSRTAVRKLEGHPSVKAENWIVRTPVKEMVFFGGLVALKPGVDGIALDKNDEWLYYGTMAHSRMFRIKTADLKNPNLSEDQLAERVQDFGAKPICDGLSIDVAGNVYITDVEHGAIVKLDQNKQLTTLVKDPRIVWADSLSYGPDGWLYIADSQIPNLILQPKEHIRASTPYHIYRFKSEVAGIAGQ